MKEQKIAVCGAADAKAMVDSVFKESLNKSFEQVREELGEEAIQEIEASFAAREEKIAGKHFAINIEMLEDRRRHIIGIQRALKAHGVGPNTQCPCGSGKKHKKCCRPLMDNNNVPWRYVADRMKMRTRDESIANQVSAAMGVLG